MLSRILQLVVLGFLSFVLAACEGTFGTQEGTGEPAAVDSSPTTGTAAGSSISSTPLGGGTAFTGHPLDDPESLLSRRTVYFAFDSSELDAEGQRIAGAHAAYLAGNPGATVTLEGHADERGTREYNLALGERRGESVRRLMTLLGASSPQLGVVSYGKERPAVDGHDESAWQYNRRVEIVYTSRGG